MINYPDSSEVNLTVKAHFQVMFNVSISFSSIIQSHLSSNCAEFQPTWTLYFQKRMVSLQKIHIQVDRLYSLRMKLNLSTFVSVEIYDGPGTLSPKVHIAQYTDLSTFQCILYSFTRHKETVNTKLNQIMYSSESLTQLEKVYVNPDSLKTMHYFTGMCTGNLVGSSVGNSVGNAVGNLAGNAVGNLARNLVGSSAGNLVGSSAGNFARNSAGNLVGNSAGNLAGNSAGNAEEIFWEILREILWELL